jgi:hypothetical protein
LRFVNSVAKGLQEAGVPARFAGFPVGPTAASVVAATIVLLATGVRPGEALAIAGYEIAFVVVPGVALLSIVAPRVRSPLAAVALGWPLGCAVELVVFAAGTAIGAQWIIWMLPVAGLVLGAVTWHRRSDTRTAAALPAPRLAISWVTVGVVAVALSALAFGPFATYPIPRSVPSVVLYPDHVFDMTLMAEATQHWPLTNPNVSGEPLRYHVAVFVHGAALARTTGVELDVIVLRALPVMLLLVVALQIAWLTTRAAPRRPWAVPAAVAILLMAGELDFDPLRTAPFVGLFLQDFVLSPTNAFALTFVIPVIGLLLGISTSREAPARRSWLLLFVLVAGAIGSKGSALPVLLGALGLYIVARAVLDRVIDRRALIALGVSVLAAVLVFVALFSGGGSAGVTIKPFAFLHYAALGDTGGPAARVFWGVITIAALLAPWAGGLLLVGRLHGTARHHGLLLACVLATGVGLFLLVSQPGASQLYFLQLAAPAGATLSAWGVARAWPADLTIRRAVGVGAGILVAALALAAAIYVWAPNDADVTPRLYSVCLVAVLAIIAAAAITSARRRASLIACGAAALVAFTALDASLDSFPPWFRLEREGRPHYTSDHADGPRGINQDLLHALVWLRDHSSRDDVIATDTQETGRGETAEPRYFYPSAYAERRTFLGGWGYTPDAVSSSASQNGMAPFADRRRLNAAAYTGDPSALHQLRDRYGVRYLVADGVHGARSAALRRLLPTVYERGEVRIYRLDDS